MQQNLEPKLELRVPRPPQSVTSKSADRERQAEVNKVIAELEVEMRRLVDLLVDQYKH